MFSIISRQMLSKSIRVLLIFAAGLSLAACSHPTQLCSNARLVSLQHQIYSYGGQWVEYGDRIDIILPSEQLYWGNSINMRPKAQQLINQIAERLTCYSTQSVAVTGYMGNYSVAETNLALARSRAMKVANILKRHQVSRLIYEQSKAIPACPSVCRQNRIEIVTNRLQ